MASNYGLVKSTPKTALQVDNPPADLAASLRPSQQSGEDAAYGVGISQKSNWELFDDYNERNATAAYSELEWE
jgi:hypothetical protein